MLFPKYIAGMVGGLAVMLMGSTATAGARPFMPQGELVAPPPGFADLCQRNEVSCLPFGQPSDQAQLASTPLTLATSSIGATQPAHVAGWTTPLVAEDDQASMTVRYAALEAYRPVIDVDFAPATGWRWAPQETAPAAPETAAVAVAVAVEPLLRAAQMRMVNLINREVNRDVHKATDFDLYGLLEYWSLPRVIAGKMYGDCEDYALEKRRRLIAAGVPAEALSMAVAVTARGESHAVLVVSFESGDWVLDNLTPWATPWEDLNYRWVQRQVAGSGSWATIG